MHRYTLIIFSSINCTVFNEHTYISLCVLMQIFKHLPWFHWMAVEPFYKNNLRFESDEHITKIYCPIMILHAEDDGVIPVFLAEKVRLWCIIYILLHDRIDCYKELIFTSDFMFQLYRAALDGFGNDTNRIEMIKIDSSYGLGHKYICRYKELPSIIRYVINIFLK